MTDDVPTAYDGYQFPGPDDWEVISGDMLEWYSEAKFLASGKPFDAALLHDHIHGSVVLTLRRCSAHMVSRQEWRPPADWTCGPSPKERQALRPFIDELFADPNKALVAGWRPIPVRR